MHATEAFKNADVNQQAEADRQFNAAVRAKSAESAGQDLAQARAQPGILGPLSAFAQRAAATANGVGNFATAGYAVPAAAGLSNLLSKATGGAVPAVSTPELQGQTDALAQQFPASNAVGNVAGAFTGLAGNSAGGITAAVSDARGAITAAVPALEQTFGRRLLTNLAANALGAAGTVATYETAKYRDDSPGLAQRFSDALDQTKQTLTSPLGLGLLAGGSALQSIVPPKQTGALGMAIDRYERVTGKQVPTEVLTGDAGLQRGARYAAQFDPKTYAAQKAEAVDGLSQYVDDMASRLGATAGGTEASRAGAANAVGELIGTREAPGPIDVRRREQMGQAFAASQARGPSQQATLLLQDAAQIIQNDRPRGLKSNLDGTLRTIIDDFTTKDGAAIPMSVDSIDGLVKQVDGLLGFASHPPTAEAAAAGSQTMAEAAQLRRALVLARSAFPEVNNASAISSDLHALMEPLRDVPIVELRDKQLSDFFSKISPNPSTWNTATAEWTPEQIQQVRGWYLYRLTSSVIDPKTGVLNEKRLNTLLRAPGDYNSQMVQQVLPGGIDELRNYAQLSQSLMKTGRFAAKDPALATGSIFRGFFSDPLSPFLRLLGPVGVKQAVRSAFAGAINNQAQKIARMGPTPIGSGMLATQAVGQTGPGAALNSAGSAVGSGLITSLGNPTQGSTQ